MIFWTNFEAICKSRKTTPTAVVRKTLGLSGSKVTAWKNGALPKEEVIEQLAEVLKCSPADFFATEPKEVAEPANDDERDILELFRKLDRKQKHEFMAMVYQYDRDIQRGDSAQKID